MLREAAGLLYLSLKDNTLSGAGWASSMRVRSDFRADSIVHAIDALDGQMAVREALNSYLSSAPSRPVNARSGYVLRELLLGKEVERLALEEDVKPATIRRFATQAMNGYYNFVLEGLDKLYPVEPPSWVAVKSTGLEDGSTDVETVWGRAAPDWARKLPYRTRVIVDAGEEGLESEDYTDSLPWYNSSPSLEARILELPHYPVVRLKSGRIVDVNRLTRYKKSPRS